MFLFHHVIVNRLSELKIGEYFTIGKDRSNDVIFHFTCAGTLRAVAFGADNIVHHIDETVYRCILDGNHAWEENLGNNVVLFSKARTDFTLLAHVALFKEGVK